MAPQPARVAARPAFKQNMVGVKAHQLLVKVDDGVRHIDQQAMDSGRVTLDQLGKLFLGTLTTEQAVLARTVALRSAWVSAAMAPKISPANPPNGDIVDQYLGHAAGHIET